MANVLTWALIYIYTVPVIFHAQVIVIVQFVAILLITCIYFTFTVNILLTEQYSI